MLNPDLVRVKHMVDAAEEAIEFTKGKTRADLEDNRMLSLSVVHLLEIIGEAANKVSPEFQSKYNKIPWRGIIGMRNRLIHGYYDIDLNIVWKTVSSDIEPLLSELKNIIKYEECQ
ncbi:uncharacterized protein with HEPN domain [Desulfitispora alkaliphila]|uniref:HepT-like ribonuclease domain-containing protein n=1 Tax=Desulfitispora alkaliphila TaxID=622674 RepID=UPI003D1CFF18